MAAPKNTKQASQCAPSDAQKALKAASKPLMSPAGGNAAARKATGTGEGEKNNANKQ